MTKTPPKPCAPPSPTAADADLAALAARYLDLWDRAGPDLRAEPPQDPSDGDDDQP